MFNIIAWLIVGGLAGWVASLIMKTNEQMGLWANVAVGVIGAVIGGWLAGMLFGEGLSSAFSIRSFVISVVGAVILIALLKAVRR